jgi:hypothetical protein
MRVKNMFPPKSKIPNPNFCFTVSGADAWTDALVLAMKILLGTYRFLEPAGKIP